MAELLKSPFRTLSSSNSFLKWSSANTLGPVSSSSKGNRKPLWYGGFLENFWWGEGNLYKSHENSQQNELDYQCN